MFNNIFNQNQMAQQAAVPNFNFGGVGFAQNNGLNFNNVAPGKTSTSTPEEMAIIKAQKGSDFNVSSDEMAKFAWDLRDGNVLAVEVVDPATEKMRTKYTGEEFYIVMQPVEVLNEYLNGLDNFVKTTAVMNTTSNQDVLKQLLGAFGVVKKLLPKAYEEGKKSYNNLNNQMQNMLSNQGYQGTFGGQAQYNGCMGVAPNYIIGNSVQQPNQMMAMLQQAAAMGAQAQAQQTAQNIQNMMQPQQQTGFNFGAMGMGAPMPTAGTMMGAGVGANAFTQGGVPQQIPTATTATPQINVPNVPMPGSLSVQGTANPGIGSTTAATTTTAAPTATITL